VLEAIEANADPALLAAEIRTIRRDAADAGEFSAALRERAYATHAALASREGNVH